MKTSHFIIVTTALLFTVMGIGHFLSPREMKMECRDAQTKRVMYEGKILFVRTIGDYAELTTPNGTTIHLSNVNCKEQ